jgi:glycosyltransferase involved in cell wall biosynthesis
MPVRYSRQANQGAYGARNSGLSLARGRFIAFYDSDDVWRPHHIRRCLEALTSHEDVDWVYGSSRIIDQASGRVLEENCFFSPDGQPKPFLALATERRGDLHVIVDMHVAELSIRRGLYCGLQNSVIRRTVFDRTGFFDTTFRNEAEDQLFAIRAILAGARLAYFRNVHVDYVVHAANSSGSSTTRTIEKHLELYSTLIRGFERLAARQDLGKAERRALHDRLAREYFWHYGYAGLWHYGLRAKALDAFRQGIRHRPWDAALWKTFALSWIRVKLAGPRHSSDDAQPRQQ